MIDRVLLDMDGVLVDMVGGICERFGWTYPSHLTDARQRCGKTTYYLAEVFGVTRDDIWPHLGREFWAGLQPLPWWQEVLSLLEERFGEENICLLTHPIETDGAVDGKRDWVRRMLPQYANRYLIGPSKEFCASPRHVLVDDHETNIAKFRLAGGHTFLFPSPWNKRYQEDAVQAVTEWLQALSVLDKSRV